MKYEIVLHDKSDLGGLLCVSLEYAGAAGWIGIALSNATRDPRFGRKEAIIGIPGIGKSMAVRAQGSGARVGQQIFALDGGPAFANPGKYDIPAGGTREGRMEEGFSGPSLELLADINKQTLMGASVSAIGGYPDGFASTIVSFEKYLREPNEIEIDPYEPTLLLYAFAPLDVSGEYDGNPEWKYTYLNLLDSSPAVSKAGPVRKR